MLDFAGLGCCEGDSCCGGCDESEEVSSEHWLSSLWLVPSSPPCFGRGMNVNQGLGEVVNEL